MFIFTSSIILLFVLFNCYSIKIYPKHSQTHFSHLFLNIIITIILIMKMRKRRTSTTTAMTTTSVIFLINMDDIGRMQDVHEIDNIDDGTANNDGHLERKGFGESFLATNLVQTPEAVLDNTLGRQLAQLFGSQTHPPGMG